VASGGESRRRALVTGLKGQDGAFVADLLLEQGYDVIGLVRGDPSRPLGAAEHLRGRVELVAGDLLDPASLVAAVAGTLPDELYHLAAPSFTPDAWRNPAQTMAAIAGATATLLEAVRDHSRQTRVFVAVSGEIFGAAPESPQHEGTPCRPQTPYAIAKLAAHQLVGRLRARDGLFACSGILYNHESERRPERFVSRKVTRAAAAIKLGLEHELALGDLDAVRDWSFAGDIMHGAWLMLQHEQANDYILASGVPHTVMELAELAFSRVGLNARDYIRVDPTLQRPPDFAPLVGDPTRARDRLGWRPTLDFEQLIVRMVETDLEALQVVSREPR
jgi:GDPmannose 4,6-dehydratase